MFVCYSIYFENILHLLSNITQQISCNPSTQNKPHVCYYDTSVVNYPSKCDTMGGSDHKWGKYKPNNRCWCAISTIENPSQVMNENP